MVTRSLCPGTLNTHSRHREGQPIVNQETIVLVACAKGKRAEPAVAHDLYTSDWFCKARAYAESASDRWYILSAKHGLVEPDQVIAPYERTMRDMDADHRRAWGRSVAIEIGRRITAPSKIVFICGAAYCDPLLEFLRFVTFKPVEVELPLAGLGIGQQKSWLMAQVAAGGDQHQRTEES